MVSRLLPAALALSALTACGSSGRYGTPGYAAAAVGVAAAGAAVNRAAGGCLAECVAGTHCNRATGLCEGGEGAPLPASPAPTSAAPARRRPLATMQTSYPPGHEFEVPPLSSDVDAGCAPPDALHGDAGGVACEMDGGTI